MPDPQMTIMKTLFIKKVPMMLSKSVRTATISSAFAVASFGVMAQQAAPTPQHDFEALKKSGDFWGFFDEYCTECHNADDFSGGVDFTAEMPDNVPANPELFEKVLVKLRGRMMPPPNHTRPDEQKTDAFIGWLESYLDEAG